MRAALLAAAACLFPPGRAISEAPTPGAPRAAFQVDAKTSRLTVETETVGLASMFGHDHRFLARDFTGTIALAPESPETAELALTVRGDGLTLVEDLSDDAHREIAAALRDVVLETGKYPEIAFRSRSVTARLNDDGSFDVKLAGDLTLHGVRRKIVVPARVTRTAQGLRATGGLELRQSDFKIKPYTFAKGTVRVKDTVAISFDLLARR
ncbi:MAG TPA: YceI family protein [Polyangia bacterium]|nr:YceI family protein [Polyangia bacterium]